MKLVTARSVVYLLALIKNIQIKRSARLLARIDGGTKIGIKIILKPLLAQYAVFLFLRHLTLKGNIAPTLVTSSLDTIKRT